MDPTWTLNFKGLDPKAETLRAALCTVGNGFFATRGSCEEFAPVTDVHYHGTHLASGFNRLPSMVSGREIFNEDLVNFQNWLPLKFAVEGVEVKDMEYTEFDRLLDVKNGILCRNFKAKDPKGRVFEVETRRFVHIATPNIAGIEWKVTPVNYSGNVVVTTEIDGSVENTGIPRYRQLSSKHLCVKDVEYTDDALLSLMTRTVQSGIECAVVTRAKVHGEGVEVLGKKSEKEEEKIREIIDVKVKEGVPFFIEKITTLYTNKCPGITFPKTDALETLREMVGGFPELLETHCLGWANMWSRFDVKIFPPEDVKEKASYDRIQMILRVHSFHMLATMSKNSVQLDWTVPARGLHGESYRGHIFWDEMFIMPFYATRSPELAKAMLMYRYNRLGKARAYARQEKFEGAMFPWQSGSNGQEETQVIHFNPNSGKWDPDNSCRQRHINIAIFVNVWTYIRMTGDNAFLQEYGAELLIDIAQFLASLATYNEEAKRYEIHGVMGPDEYHEKYKGAGPTEGGVKNNAYTNLMVCWCLREALALLDSLPKAKRQSLFRFLGLTEEKVKRWNDITTKMYIPMHEDDGMKVISHFEGYEKLEEFDWDGYRKKYENIHRLDRILKAEGNSPDIYKVSKQADLCQLFYVLPFAEVQKLFAGLGNDKFDHAEMEKIVNYYLKRTSHGSTLSNVVFASLMAQLDKADLAWEYYGKVLESDIADIQGGTSAEGIHCVPMAASITMLIQQFTGMDIQKDKIVFKPVLLPQIGGLEFKVAFKGALLAVKCSQKSLVVTSPEESPEDVTIVAGDQTVVLSPGKGHEWNL